MNTTEILNNVEQEVQHVETIKGQLIKAKKIQLHTGLDGWNSPKAYGVYRNTGGDCLGVVGESFKPMDLEMYLDSVVQSIYSSGIDVDITKLKYEEYKGGKKIAFNIPLKKYELNTKMVGDILETKLMFKTGFDGYTKCSVSYSTLRLWCSNGAARWNEDRAISFKNTKNNNDRFMLFTDQIIKASADVDNYVKMLNELTFINITEADLDKYYLKVFGINRITYHEQATRRQNTFDKINEAVAIEMQNTGENMFSVLQGVTRYLTHEVAEKEEDLLFSSANKINSLAHSVAFNFN